VVAGGEGKPARKDQGARADLVGGDVKVGVDRRGWNNDDPRRRRWSLTTAAVFRCGGSPVVDRRWGKSFMGSRRFSQATWRELGRPEGRVPTTTRNGGGGGELVGEVDAVLKGGDGEAGELHGITAKLEVMVWLEKGWGELSTVARSGGNGRVHRRRGLATWVRGNEIEPVRKL
jgi:hypothetical protein